MQLEGAPQPRTLVKKLFGPSSVVADARIDAASYCGQIGQQSTQAKTHHTNLACAPIHGSRLLYCCLDVCNRLIDLVCRLLLEKKQNKVDNVEYSRTAGLR